MGQAVGTAAAIAVNRNTTPRGVYQKELTELQHTLMDDDVWLPNVPRPVSRLVQEAKLTGKGEGLELLRNGIDRPAEDSYNGWNAPIGEMAELRWDSPTTVKEIRLTLDSDLNRVDSARSSRGTGLERQLAKNMRHYYPLDAEPWHVPETLIKTLSVEAESGDGTWTEAAVLENNYQRLVRLNPVINQPVTALRVIPLETWGDSRSRIFSIDIS